MYSAKISSVTFPVLQQECGLWNFPDERPLRRDEAIGALRGLGEIVFEKTLRPLVLTQHLVVVKKG